MGDKLQGQQAVFYDADLGQYYTQTPANNSSLDRMRGTNMNPVYGLNSELAQYGQQNNLLSSLFGRNAERTYLSNFNQKQQAEQSPYQYANTSLESLFPSSQGSSNSTLAGLLSVSPSATGSASSGAGRFM